MLTKLRSFPLAHWRGEVAFFPTLFLTLIGLRGAISVLGGIGFFTLDVAILAWQIIGTFRSYMRVQSDRHDLGTTILFYVGTLACVLLLTFSHLDRVTRDYETDLSKAPVVETGLRLVPTYIRVNGPITFAMATALKTALAENPEVTRLVLTSDGGRVFAARAIVLLVREYHLETRVEDRCSSACTLIFIAGDVRSMEPDARLGFHGYTQDEYVESVKPREEESKDRAAFLAQGIAPDFVARIFTAPPNQLWHPDRSTLEAAGVLTAP